MNTINEREPGLGRVGAPQNDSGAGFWRNLGMIRPAAWVIAVAIFVGMQLLLWFIVLPSEHPDLSDAPESVRVLFSMGAVRLVLSFLPGLALASLILLIGFIYVDSKRRRMRYTMWTLLAIFIPNLIGIILYFILRDPLPTPCPKCATPAHASMSFCPACGTELLRACRVCHKKIEINWMNCAYCGVPIAGGQAKKEG